MQRFIDMCSQWSAVLGDVIGCQTWGQNYMVMPVYVCGDSSILNQATLSQIHIHSHNVVVSSVKLDELRPDLDYVISILKKAVLCSVWLGLLYQTIFHQDNAAPLLSIFCLLSPSLYLSGYVHIIVCICMYMFLFGSVCKKETQANSALDKVWVMSMPW